MLQSIKRATSLKKNLQNFWHRKAVTRFKIEI